MACADLPPEYSVMRHQRKCRECGRMVKMTTYFGDEYPAWKRWFVRLRETVLSPQTTCPECKYPILREYGR